MTPLSTILIPELQYYFSKFIKNSTLNKNLTWFPEEMDILYLGENKSFIHLLFNEDFPHDEYLYLYRDTAKSEWPLLVQTRLSLFPVTSKYYICDAINGNINIFGLQDDDILMLDFLLHYRKYKTLDDYKFNLEDISYDDLTTGLSKLIYIYLDLKLNNNYSLYDNTTVISDKSNVLESIYECYMIEEIFKYLQSKQIIDPQT